MSRTILDEIVAHKRREVADRSRSVTINALEAQITQSPSPRGFTQALLEKITEGDPAVIAEIKKASPSKGVIREDFDPADIARSYERAEAACLSVLTDEHFFQGCDEYLRIVRDAVAIPILRKDFIIDKYQIVEARAMGADCILLIVSVLDIMQLTTFFQFARNLNLDVLIEVHDDNELAAALSLQPTMIGINNRNLKTFETNIDTTFSLIESVPDNILIVAESGISERADVEALRAKNVNAFLVGEAFMREEDPGEALTALFFS